MPPDIKGLYAVTPDTPDTAGLLGLVKAAIAGGATLVQYRNKVATAELLRQQASELLTVCRHHDVPLIINDHTQLCLELDADGVHIGADDGDISTVRKLLGHKIIGVSCYNRMELAEQAESAGADYVAFGSCFGSATKPLAVKASLDLFRTAKSQLNLPIVAIGGITLDNAALVINAGADAVAVINALWHANDVTQIVQHFSDFFTEHHHEQKPTTV